MPKKPQIKTITILLVLILIATGCKPEKKEILENTESNAAKNEEIVITKIDSTQFPKGIKHEGFIKNAVRWKDKLGDNIVITTETGIYTNKKFKHEFDDSSDAELFAYHYIISNNEAKQNWKMYDFIADCPVDIVASFVKNSFEVTDLNKNGIAEVWLMYKTVCHGDVSPSEMKIIMYEGTQKYAMRGENKVQIGVEDNGEKSYEGGEFKYDAKFQNAPKEFKEHAENLWNKNLIENWDN